MWQWLYSGSGYELAGTTWQSERVEGTLFPANLAVATSLFATPDWPLPHPNTILAFEDINEDDYRIDRLLTQWRHARVFKSVVGIALGRFSWNDPLPEDVRYDATLALRDRLMDLDVPIVAELPFGHPEGDNFALPIGAPVVLDGDRGVLKILTRS
ncbi:MAG: LD-carboxypeptidase, partial [Cyanobacteria bacterium J06648_11]